MLIVEDLKSRSALGPSQRTMMRNVAELLTFAGEILRFAAEHGANPLMVKHLTSRYARLMEQADDAVRWMGEREVASADDRRQNHPEARREKIQQARARYPSLMVEQVKAEVPVSNGEWHEWSARVPAKERRR